MRFFLLPSIILGLSLYGAVKVGSESYERVKANDQVISVTGSADRMITSDTVKWTGSFSRSTDAAGLKDANVSMKNDLQTVLNLLKARGVKEEEITVQPMSVNQVCEGQQAVPYYDRGGGPTCGTSKVAGFNLQQGIVVQSGSVKEVTKLAQEAPTSLVQDGVLFTSLGLEYYYNKLADLKLEMLSEATKNAKERAQKIAETTGSAIGKPQAAAMGVFQINAPNSVDVSDYGVYDTSSIEKKVTSVVRMTFLLQ